MPSLTITAEEARKLVSALSLIVSENTTCNIVLSQHSSNGIGANLYVGLANSEEKTDITDYGVW